MHAMGVSDPVSIGYTIYASRLAVLTVIFWHADLLPNPFHALKRSDHTRD